MGNRTGHTAPLYWVDAFGDHPFTGNPAAVCLLEGPVDEQWMQNLAAEMGLSETAFVRPEGDHFSLRWFTPVAEVDLCGHATVASAAALRAAGRAADGSTVSFATRSGILGARLDGDLVELDLPAVAPEPAAPPAALAALGAVAATRAPGTLMLELADADAVRTAEVDLEAVSALDVRVLYLTAAGLDDADYVLRVFGPTIGIDEDPATGSAHCLLGPYWAERLDRTTLRASQLSRRGGTFEVRVTSDRVAVAGRAVIVVQGEVVLP